MGMLKPDTKDWETAWGELRRLRPSLNGWQYLGANAAYNAHVFRLRAGVSGNDTGRNQVQMIRVENGMAQEVR